MKKIFTISINFILYGLCCLFFFSHLAGCSAMKEAAPAPNTNQPALGSWPPKHVLVLLARHANFSGGGRTHILKIDGKPIGNLTHDNYYRLEMWPGQYQFTIERPREDFFGQVSPPDHVSRRFNLTRLPSGNAYLCSYTDGLGSGGFKLEPITNFPIQLNDRTEVLSFNARDTAQVTRHFSVRYDGPALHGRPHGEGMLTWPDDTAYIGSFEHGVATRKARFIYPDGRVFMGPNRKGRPANTGVLMTAGGRILFAGHFSQEQPDGRGLRPGPDGAEFCYYDRGRDITKTFRKLAKEALDNEDLQQIETFANRAESIATEITTLKTRLKSLATQHDPDKWQKTLARSQKKIKILERRKKHMELNKAAETEAFINELEDSRFKRELAKEKLIRSHHLSQIEKERQWCLEEFAQDHKLCICAPFADDFDHWEECGETFYQRYID